MSRRLAAILVADVVGYSRLMASDEGATLSALRRHRETLFDPAVAAHGGRIVVLNRSSDPAYPDSAHVSGSTFQIYLPVEGARPGKGCAAFS